MRGGAYARSWQRGVVKQASQILGGCLSQKSLFFCFVFFRDDVRYLATFLKEKKISAAHTSHQRKSFFFVQKKERCENRVGGLFPQPQAASQQVCVYRAL